MTPRPFGNRVFIQRDEVKEERRGLIWVPDKARAKPQEGTVIAIGPDVTTVQVGDRVIFGRYSVLDVAPHGLVIREPDLIAVIE